VDIAKKRILLQQRHSLAQHCLTVVHLSTYIHTTLGTGRRKEKKRILYYASLGPPCRPPIPPLGCLFSFFLLLGPPLACPFSFFLSGPIVPPLGCLFSFFLLHWAREWRAPLALTQVHHGSRLSDSCEDGEALSSVHSTALRKKRITGNHRCTNKIQVLQVLKVLHPRSCFANNKPKSVPRSRLFRVTNSQLRRACAVTGVTP